jgi:hypothetical protein
MIFEIYNGRNAFYQWDSNQQLILNGLGLNTEIHFRSINESAALVVKPYVKNNKILVDVPNILLQSSENIVVWAYDDRHTKAQAVFTVIPRQRPADYAYTETEIWTYEKLEGLILEELERRVNEYFTENAVAWEFLQEKLFGDELITGTATIDAEGTLLWDGNKDAMPVVINTNPRVPWSYVSDNVPTMEDINKGYFLAIMGYNGTEVEVKLGNNPIESDNYISFSDMDGQYIYIIKQPCKIGSGEFKRAGVYFYSTMNSEYGYVCRFGINGYTFTPATERAAINDNFISNDIQRVGEPLYLYDTNGVKYEIIANTNGTIALKVT